MARKLEQTASRRRERIHQENRVPSRPWKEDPRKTIALHPTKDRHHRQVEDLLLNTIISNSNIPEIVVVVVVRRLRIVIAITMMEVAAAVAVAEAHPEIVTT